MVSIHFFAIIKYLNCVDPSLKIVFSPLIYHTSLLLLEISYKNLVVCNSETSEIVFSVPFVLSHLFYISLHDAVYFSFNIEVFIC